MAEQIIDGKGRGYRAEVNANGLLEVNAVTEATYGYISRTTQRAFVASSGAITTDGTANNIFILTNLSSSKNIVIVQLDISMTTNGTITINVNETYSAGGTGVTPANLNRSSGIPSVITNTDCYYGDDMTFTGTAIAYANFVNLANTPFREEFADALILGYNNSLSVNLDAAAGTAYVSVKYYEINA